MEIKADELAQLLKLAGVEAQPEMEPMPAEEPVAVDVEMPAVTEPACDDEESAMMVMGENMARDCSYSEEKHDQYISALEDFIMQHYGDWWRQGIYEEDRLIQIVAEMIESWKMIGDTEFGPLFNEDGSVNTGAFEMYYGMASNEVDLKDLGESEEEDCTNGDYESMDNGYTCGHDVALDATNDNPSGDDKNEFTMPEDNPKAVKECEETKAIHESLVSKYADFLAEQEVEERVGFRSPDRDLGEPTDEFADEVEEGRYYKGKKGKSADQKHGKGRKLDRNSEEFKALAAMYQKKAQEKDDAKAAMVGEEEQLDELGNVHSATYSADYEEKLGDLVQELLDSGEAYTEEDAYAMAIEMLDGTVEPGVGDEIVDPDEIEAPYQMGMGMPDPYDPSGEHADSEEDHLDYLRGLAGL